MNFQHYSDISEVFQGQIEVFTSKFVIKLDLEVKVQINLDRVWTPYPSIGW